MITSPPRSRFLSVALISGLLAAGFAFAQPPGSAPHGPGEGRRQEKPAVAPAVPPMERWDDWSDFYLSSPVDPGRDPMGWFSYQYLRASVLQRRGQLLDHVRTRVLDSEELADCEEPKRERVKRILDLRQELIVLDQEHFVGLFHEEARQVAAGFAAWEERADEDSPRRRIAATSRQRLQELLDEGETFETLVSGMEELSSDRWRTGRRHTAREDRLRREIQLLEIRLKNLREEVERLDWENRMDSESEEDPRARRLREEEHRLREDGSLMHRPGHEERVLMPGLGEEDERHPATQDPADELPPRRPSERGQSTR